MNKTDRDADRMKELKKEKKKKKEHGTNRNCIKKRKEKGLKYRGGCKVVCVCVCSDCRTVLVVSLFRKREEKKRKDKNEDIKE